MGACATKPKVKDDAAAPPPISAPEKPPPPAPKDNQVPIGRSHDQPNEKVDGKMVGETEIKLLESAAKTLSENAEQEVPSLKDNMLEGSDQINKAVEVIKEQVPRQSDDENPPHESPTKLAQPKTKPHATRESQTMPPPQSETMKNESSNKPPMSKTGTQSSSTKENSETKTVSEVKKDQSSLEYLDASIDKAVIETAPKKPPTEVEKHKLGNVVNPDSKEKKEFIADTKIQSNGKVTEEKESIASATKTETTHPGERELKCS